MFFFSSSSIFRFLLQCLEDLDASLRKLNSRLFVIRGQPANVFPRLFKVSVDRTTVLIISLKESFCFLLFEDVTLGSDVFSLSLCQEWKISRLTFEYDSEPFGKERDAAIKKLAMEAGVEVIVKISHTLYDLDK